MVRRGRTMKSDESDEIHLWWMKSLRDEIRSKSG